MTRVLLLALWLALAGCTTQPAQISRTPISGLGIISNLPTNANNILMGLTVFENTFEETQVPWDFSKAVAEEFKRQVEKRGKRFQDLSDIPQIEERRDDWFETGYSLKFGLSQHRLSATNAAILQRAMAENSLDAIVLLRPREFNSDTPYGLANPTGAFGIFKRGGVFMKDTTYTFVQIEGRVIAGSPLAVLEDLDGSNLIRIYRGDASSDMQSAEFKSQIATQIADAVSNMLGELGI